ncbi:MAG: hypothetical protein QOI61_637 [Actinomycetota bacterium]|jgi:hypothetical protein
MLRRAHRALLGASLGLASVGGLALIGGPTPASALDGKVPLNPTIKPDAVLSPGQSVTLKNETPLAGTLAFYSPEACRGRPATTDEAIAPATCKAYRIVLNLDTNPLARNTVLIEADFDQLQPRSLPLVVAGLNPAPLNGVNVYVWDWEDHYLGQDYPDPTLEPLIGPGDPEDEPPGTNTFASPERGSFKAKYKVYDITVQATQGANQGYELRLRFSNEIFTKPFEVLDDTLGAPTGPIDEPQGSQFAPPFTGGYGNSVVQPLPLVDVIADGDIAGIGLGVNEQFNAQQALAFGTQTRRVAAIADPPSTLALVAGMILFPLIAGAGAVFALRRRRQALVS